MQGVVHEIYERSFARFRALALDPSIIGDCNDQVDDSKEESQVKLGKIQGLQNPRSPGGIFKRSEVSAPEKKKRPPPRLDTAPAPWTLC